MTDKIVIAMDFVRFIDGDKITQMLADGWQPIADNFTSQKEMKHEEHFENGGHPYITFVKYASPVLVDSRVITAESEETLRDNILPLIKDGWIPLNEVRFETEAGFYQTWEKYESPAPAPLRESTPEPAPTSESKTAKKKCPVCKKKTIDPITHIAGCDCEIPF